MPLSFSSGGYLCNSWGGPPGPRGSPRTRSSLEESGVCHRRQADRGVGRGPGGPPHNLAEYSFGEN